MFGVKLRYSHATSWIDGSVLACDADGPGFDSLGHLSVLLLSYKVSGIFENFLGVLSYREHPIVSGSISRTFFAGINSTQKKPLADLSAKSGGSGSTLVG